MPRHSGHGIEGQNGIFKASGEALKGPQTLAFPFLNPLFQAGKTPDSWGLNRTFTSERATKKWTSV